MCPRCPASPSLHHVSQAERFTEQSVTQLPFTRHVTKTFCSSGLEDFHFPVHCQICSSLCEVQPSCPTGPHPDEERPTAALLTRSSQIPLEIIQWGFHRAFLSHMGEPNLRVWRSGGATPLMPQSQRGQARSKPLRVPLSPNIPVPQHTHALSIFLSSLSLQKDPGLWLGHYDLTAGLVKPNSCCFPKSTF